MNLRMKILVFNWRDIKHPKSGGAEIATMVHAKAWIKAGHSVVWFSPKFKDAKNTEVIERIRIIRKGNKVSVYFWAIIFYLFSGEKFDMVVDQIHGIPFFTPLFVRKPKIAFIHETATELWDYMEPFPINTMGKIIEPIYFKMYKRMTFWTPSDSTIRDLVKQEINKKNCVKILCGINNKVLKYPVEKNNKPVFIFVSRLVKMKGIEDVIDSFSIIRKKNKEAILWIVGGGEKPYINLLKRKVKYLHLQKSVEFFGFVSEQTKLDLMRKAQILLHASVKEGWGLVVIEAASQSTPSVVYNVAGLSESVVNDKTGVVIDRNSPKELANQAIKLFNDKKRYERFQKNGLERARSLKWEDATNQSLKLLEFKYNERKKVLN